MLECLCETEGDLVSLGSAEGAPLCSLVKVTGQFSIHTQCLTVQQGNSSAEKPPHFHKAGYVFFSVFFLVL